MAPVLLIEHTHSNYFYPKHKMILLTLAHLPRSQKTGLRAPDLDWDWQNTFCNSNYFYPKHKMILLTLAYLPWSNGAGGMYAVLFLSLDELPVQSAPISWRELQVIFCKTENDD
jgi:hypothetical protein